MSMRLLSLCISLQYNKWITMYTSYPGDAVNSLVPVMLCSAFLVKTNNPLFQIFYQHGFTALSFFVAMLVGFILVALGVLIFVFCYRRCKGASVMPSSAEVRFFHLIMKNQ